MTYRITENINLPFKVMPVVQEYGKSRIEYSVKIRSIFDQTEYPNLREFYNQVVAKQAEQIVLKKK